MKKITHMLAGVSMLVLAANVVAAEEPMVLSAAQMDGVNGGAIVILQGAGIAGSGSSALANVSGLTWTYTDVLADPTGIISGLQQVYALGSGQATAFSVYDGAGIGGAATGSTSSATSQLF